MENFRKINHKNMSKILLGLGSLVIGFSFISCSKQNNEIESDETKKSEDTSKVYDLNGAFDVSDYLMVQGSKVVNLDGEQVQLHGINAGGYLVTERWMCAATMSHGTTDHYRMTETLVNRFGKEKTLDLWEYYRENFWTEQDFQNIKDMGMNVIRLPFSYMSFDPAYNNVRAKSGQEFNFDVVDDFVEKAAAHGLYIILDMHGAYGSQNGQDHSGFVYSTAEEVDFFSNEENQKKTIHLWEEIAKHYKDVNSIAAYDLLNEPGEKAGSTTTRHFEFFDKVYKAIRKIDEDRPLIFESCWDGQNLPSPKEYGWEGAIYSFHNYSGNYTVDGNFTSYVNKLKGVDAQKFNVPLYMGEFNCYGMEEGWNLVLSLLNSNGWHWTSWTYKLNIINEGQYAGWGVYFSHAERAVVDVDSLEEIKDKRFKIDTAHEDTTLMTFESKRTLKQIMMRHA